MKWNITEGSLMFRHELILFYFIKNKTPPLQASHSRRRKDLLAFVEWLWKKTKDHNQKLLEVWNFQQPKPNDHIEAILQKLKGSDLHIWKLTKIRINFLKNMTNYNLTFTPKKKNMTNYTPWPNSYCVLFHKIYSLVQ